MLLEQAIELFQRTGVMQEGHFKLTSGQHSNRYMQCAKLFQYPKESMKVCEEIAEFFRDKDVDLVAGPAIGGIVMAYEVARILCARGAEVRSIFAERENGVMTLRRGFQVEAGQRALVVEDVVTTGGSVKEVIEILRAQGAEIVGVGSVVDRSQGTVDFPVGGSKIPFYACAALKVESWDPDACPLCRQGLPIVKPGSRT
ncbi:MAG: orotate phosphoribosyltransferase [Synergistaceae bacterium]|jgi:orotate phosphoribosyltransferase|nr:orotate phosphoribosyltransferase [Synergistaceae bacterium]